MIAEFRTVSGHRVDLADVQVDDLHIKDVAHHLAWTCRFNGAIEPWYNNAQHSYLVSEIAAYLSEQDGAPHFLVNQAALAGHLHDAAEALIGDITGPVKKALRHFGAMYGLRSPVDVLEQQIHAQVEARWDLPAGSLTGLALSPGFDGLYRIVKKADGLAYRIEAAVLRGHASPDDLDYSRFAGSPTNEIWDRETARSRFLDRFYELERP